MAMIKRLAGYPAGNPAILNTRYPAGYASSKIRNAAGYRI
jgi:hypothetical protein